MPRGFPNTILNDNDEFCFRTTIKLLLDEFTSQLNDIRSDELNPQPMKGDPMRISLKPNAIPKKVTGARRVPLRYKEGADSIVQNLMNKKVIVPVNITTDWCSPAFFVPKADMIRVRLVTDNTHLNIFVKRPVHPFPCTTETLQAIPSTATCFAKLDAVHGYFQLALEPKSSLITILISTRKIKISQSIYGVKCFLRPMVLQIRCVSRRTSLGQETGRQHHHLGRH